jgi:hypothetical protein
MQLLPDYLISYLPVCARYSKKLNHGQMGVAPNPLPGLPCDSLHTQMWWRTCSSKCISTWKGLVKYDKQLADHLLLSNFLWHLANLEYDLISKEVACIHNNPYPKFSYFGLQDVVRVCWPASQAALTCASKNNPPRKHVRLGQGRTFNSSRLGLFHMKVRTGAHGKKKWLEVTS